MKLLIVDDEKLTREGILKTLPLEKLGIHQTFLADDGIHAVSYTHLMQNRWNRRYQPYLT